jgi:hypothetical protein
MGLQDEKVKSVSILMVKTTIYDKYIRKEGEIKLKDSETKPIETKIFRAIIKEN